MLKKRTALLCSLLLAATACETRVGDFTAISTKNIYAKGVDVAKLPSKAGCEGYKSWVLGIGLNLKDPVDMALASGGGNVMIDCAVYREDYVIVTGIKVRGTVVNVPYTGAAQAHGIPVRTTDAAQFPSL